MFEWIVYDDNNLLKYDNRTLEERFTHISDKYETRTKYIVRGNLSIDPSIHVCHDKNDKVIAYTITKDSNIGYIKHFRFKTIEEYILVKVNAGYAHRKGKDLSWLLNNSDDKILNTFFSSNIYTQEKEEYGKLLLSKLRLKNNFQ